MALGSFHFQSRTLQPLQLQTTFPCCCQSCHSCHLDLVLSCVTGVGRNFSSSAQPAHFKFTALLWFWTSSNIFFHDWFSKLKFARITFYPRNNLTTTEQKAFFCAAAFLVLAFSDPLTPKRFLTRPNEAKDYNSYSKLEHI